MALLCLQYIYLYLEVIVDSTVIKNIQNSIGYEFKNSRLLEQAFVRKSYSKEHPEFISNEVLEFYGDRALDLYITKAMYDNFSTITADNQFYSEKSEGQLTEIKAFNVNKNSLSHCIRMSHFQKYLLMNKSDEKNKVFDSPNVQEDLFEAIIGAVAVDCEWNYEKIFKVCRNMLKLADFEMDYLSWLYNWCKEQQYEIPAFQLELGSYTESTKNKLYNWGDYYEEQEKKQNKDWANFEIKKCKLYIKEIDIEVESSLDNICASQMDCAKQIYDTIQKRESIQAIGNLDIDTAVNQLNILFQKNYIKEPKYSFTEDYDEDGNPIWYCNCALDELEESFYGDSSIKKEAKKKAAYEALCALLN